MTTSNSQPTKAVKNPFPMEKMQMKCCLYWWNVFLALLCFMVFIGDLVVNYGMTVGNWGNRAHFQLFSQFVTQITPASWTFMIWNVVYGLILIWFFYVLFLLFCRQPCMYNEKPVFPSIFWFLFAVVHVVNALYIYSWFHRTTNNFDSNLLITGIVSTVLTLLLFVVNVIAFVACFRKTDDQPYPNNNNNNKYEFNEIEMEPSVNKTQETSCMMNTNKQVPTDDGKQHSNCMKMNYCCRWNNNNNNNGERSSPCKDCQNCLLRTLTLNGLPLYAMWSTILTIIHWEIVFQYVFHWSGSASCIFSLTCLTVILWIYWTLDLCVLRRYFAYTWLSHIVLIIALSGIISRYRSIGHSRLPALIFVFILLVISCMVIALKFISLCLCPPRRGRLSSV